MIKQINFVILKELFIKCEEFERNYHELYIVQYPFFNAPKDIKVVCTRA